jgi:hypothetical protein
MGSRSKQQSKFTMKDIATISALLFRQGAAVSPQILEQARAQNPKRQILLERERHLIFFVHSQLFIFLCVCILTCGSERKIRIFNAGRPLATQLPQVKFIPPWKQMLRDEVESSMVMVQNASAEEESALDEAIAGLILRIQPSTSLPNERIQTKTEVKHARRLANQCSLEVLEANNKEWFEKLQSKSFKAAALEAIVRHLKLPVALSATKTKTECARRFLLAGLFNDEALKPAQDEIKEQLADADSLLALNPGGNSAPSSQVDGEKVDDDEENEELVENNNDDENEDSESGDDESILRPDLSHDSGEELEHAEPAELSKGSKRKNAST